MSKFRTSRRQFLRLSAGAASTAVVLSCFPSTSTPTVSPTAETPQTAGRFPLGRIEGPVVITDLAKYPKTLKEAPELAALVNSGKLPKVGDRVGPDPIVVQTLQSNGKYGGTIRKGFNGSGDFVNFTRFGSGPDTLLYWDYMWQKVRPNIAKSFDMSPDGKTLTISLRKMFWSNGDPVTTEDIRFWYEDIYKNTALVKGTTPVMRINGKDVGLKIVDAQTFQYVSPDPNYLLPDAIAATEGPWGGSYNAITLISPSKFLKQFHPKYATGGQAAVDKLAADAKLAGWPALFLFKMGLQFNADTPSLNPWIVRKGNEINTPVWTLDRNPYSVWVDTDGNQLPYVNTVTHALGENQEILNLRALAGEYDFQDRFLDMTKLPLFIDGQDKGGYKVFLDPAEGNDYGLRLNLSNNLNADASPDTEMNALMQNVDFRRALSMGIDRAQINEAFFLGAGAPGSYAPQNASNKYFPGKDVVNKWSTLDVAQAKKLLDGVLPTKDASGFRLRKDGKTRLRIEYLCVVGSFADFAAMGEMMKTHLAKIGVDMNVSGLATNLYSARLAANQFNVIGFSVGTEDLFLSPGRAFPSTAPELGSDYALWFQTGGAKGVEPFKDLKDLMDLWNRAYAAPEADRIKMGKDWWTKAVDIQLQIGVIGADLAVYGFHYAKNTLGNVPQRVINAATMNSPRQALPQTFYYK
jgi:peptide/nickel transport system substrate-binding protein